MSSELIPAEVLASFFRHRSPFAGRFSRAVQQFELAVAQGRPAERRDGLDDATRLWLADLETPLDWLDHLWDSTAGAQIRWRSQLIDVVRRAIKQLPHSAVADSEARHSLRLVLPVYLLFIRRHRVAELLPAVAHRAFYARGWIHVPELRSPLLMAAYACSLSVEGRDFLRRVLREPAVIEAMDNRQRAVFALEYLASALEPGMSGRAAGGRRLQAEIALLIDRIMSGAPAAVVLSVNGFYEFAHEVKAGMEEIIAAVPGNPALCQSIRDLESAVLDLGDKYTEPDSEARAREMLLRIMSGGSGIGANPAPPVSRDNRRAAGSDV